MIRGRNPLVFPMQTKKDNNHFFHRIIRYGGEVIHHIFRGMVVVHIVIWPLFMLMCLANL